MMEKTKFQQEIAVLLPEISVLFNEPMSKHTSFRIGGNAEIMAFPESGEQLKKLCKAVDEELTDQERQVIVARYGLGGGTPLRQREVAKLTGISRSYVSRIEKRALEKLRIAIG